MQLVTFVHEAPSQRHVPGHCGGSGCDRPGDDWDAHVPPGGSQENGSLYYHVRIIAPATALDGERGKIVHVGPTTEKIELDRNVMSHSAIETLAFVRGRCEWVRDDS